MATVDSYWPWRNVLLSLPKHGGVIGAYWLHHLASGKYYVGAVTDIYRGLSVVGTRLNNGTFPNVELQALVSQSPECVLQLLVPDHRLPEEERLLLARQTAKQWIQQFGDHCINNATKNKRVAHSPASKRLLTGRKTPKQSEWLRKHPNFQIPPVDFLHQAWFGASA